MAERIDIERALDALVSDEAGMPFQNLAVVLAKQRWPELIACERHNDRGLDAYAPPQVSAGGVAKGLVSSTTGELKKLNDDAKTAKQNYPALSMLMFATLAKVTQEKKEQWQEKIRSAHGLDLIVLSREDIITGLQLPKNAGLCKAHLKLDVHHEMSLVEALQRAREAAGEVAVEWAQHPRLAGQPQITLDVQVLDSNGRETTERFPTAAIRALMLQGRRLIIEAPAGRGKTTTLVHLAKGSSPGGGISILVDLPVARATSIAWRTRTHSVV